MSEWIKLEDFNFEDENLIQIHVDTRDFCVFGRTESDKEVIQYPTRVVTIEKIKEALIRFKENSGGEREWRHFDIVDTKTRNGWDFKYLRFKKSSEGWLFIKSDSDKERGIDSAYPAEYLDKEGVDWVEWYEKNRPVKEEVQTYENSIHKSTDSYVVYENPLSDYQRISKPSQYIRETPKVQNNASCPCGSGKKFKKCCKNKQL